MTMLSCWTCCWLRVRQRSLQAVRHSRRSRAIERSQLAILKSVEIVGEAASRVSTDIKETHPEIPWAGIVGMRNRLVHGYFDVNLVRVWETVEQDIPRLIMQLEGLISEEQT